MQLFSDTNDKIKQLQDFSKNTNNWSVITEIRNEM